MGPTQSRPISLFSRTSSTVSPGSRSVWTLLIVSLLLAPVTDEAAPASTGPPNPKLERPKAPTATGIQLASSRPWSADIPAKGALSVLQMRPSLPKVR